MKYNINHTDYYNEFQSHKQLHYVGGRRGSAPGCIGIYAAASCELAAAAAALVFIQDTINSTIRRSSAPMDQHNQMAAPPNNALGDNAIVDQMLS